MQSFDDEPMGGGGVGGAEGDEVGACGIYKNLTGFVISPSIGK